MKICEITAPTIKSATGPHGQINRKTSDRIVDPHGYFAKNKRAIKKRRFRPTSK